MRCAAEMCSVTRHESHRCFFLQGQSADGSEVSFNSDEGFGSPHLTCRKRSSAAILGMIDSQAEVCFQILNVSKEVFENIYNGWAVLQQSFQCVMVSRLVYLVIFPTHYASAAKHTTKLLLAAISPVTPGGHIFEPTGIVW